MWKSFGIRRASPIAQESEEAALQPSHSAGRRPHSSWNSSKHTIYPQWPVSQRQKPYYGLIEHLVQPSKYASSILCFQARVNTELPRAGIYCSYIDSQAQLTWGRRLAVQPLESRLFLKLLSQESKEVPRVSNGEEIGFEWRLCAPIVEEKV